MNVRDIACQQRQLEKETKKDKEMLYRTLSNVPPIHICRTERERDVNMRDAVNEDD